MAKLYFYYATMSAGKTALLLQNDYNNIEKKISSMLFVPNIYSENSLIDSRIGIKKIAFSITESLNIFKYLKSLYLKPKFIFIDEAQFLSKKHIFEILAIVDLLEINVYAYGLRTDFRGKLFIGSKYLFSFADKIFEVKSLCLCGNKAIMNARFFLGKKITSGSQIDTDKKKYLSLCRYHYYNFLF